MNHLNVFNVFQMLVPYIYITCAVYLGLCRYPKTRCFFADTESPAFERRTWPPTAILQLARADNLIQMQ